MPSITTVHLTKKFGAFTALHDLNLSIEGSKCVGFLGPNGAGKTTTLKLLSDMIFPTSGEAFLNGVPVRADRKRALAQAGVLIETPEIYASLTPREALGMVASLRGLPHAEQPGRIRAVLDEVKMAEWADKKVGKFSKGMKQRINIAAALLTDPEVLLLDEPSTGLDPRGMAEVREIIRGLKRDRRLIFMSSHILSEVADVCDEVALVNRGELLFYDTLDRVTARFARGSAPVDVAFARPVPDAELTGRLATLPGVSSVQRLDPTHVRLVVTPAGPDGPERLFSAVAALGLGAMQLRETASALEDAYMSLVEKGD